jgi:hypothetical protein
MKRLLAVLVGAALVAVAGCGGGTGGTASPTPSASAAPAPTTSTAAPVHEPTVPSTPHGDGWMTGTLTVRHQVTVPPVPTVVGIRHAQHPSEGFDRIVFDVSGPLPGYQVRYVAQPIADGSGQPVSMPGRRFLQIRFEPANAHNDAGAPTVVRAQTLGHPMLEAYAVTGDFEAVVTVVLGLDDVVAYRVGELSGRIYLDVAA